MGFDTLICSHCVVHWSFSPLFYLLWDERQCDPQVSPVNHPAFKLFKFSPWFCCCFQFQMTQTEYLLNFYYFFGIVEAAVSSPESWHFSVYTENDKLFMTGFSVLGRVKVHAEQHNVARKWPHQREWEGAGEVRLKWLLMTWDWVFWVFTGISSHLTLDDKKRMQGFCSCDKGCSGRGAGGGGDHMGYWGSTDGAAAEGLLFVGLILTMFTAFTVVGCFWRPRSDVGRWKAASESAAWITSR